MCGIAGIIHLKGERIPGVETRLGVMNSLLVHRGPDDEGIWVDGEGSVGLGHRRLTIIDLTAAGHQPMAGPNHTVITYNGEVYNYLELRDKYRGDWDFRTHSDTETILA